MICFPPTSSIIEIPADKRFDSVFLNEMVAKAAQNLLIIRDSVVEKEISQEQKVIILEASNSARFFTTLFACWSLGYFVGVISKSATSFEVKNLVEFTNAKILVVETADKLLAAGTRIQSVLHSDLYTERTKIVPKLYSAFGISLLDRAGLLLFTSGTTGIPKAVQLTLRSVITRAKLNSYNLLIDVNSRALNFLPTHFGHGLIGNCLTPIFTGADLFIAPSNDLEILSNFGNIVDSCGIDILSSVPSHWQIILSLSGEPQGDHLRTVCVGSSPLSVSKWQDIFKFVTSKHQVSVFNTYGITECSNWISGSSYNNDFSESGLVGNGWGTSFAIKNESGEVSQIGEGEILVLSPSVMTGYFDDQEKTKEVFNGIYFETGDLGALREDGQLILKGRSKFLINKGGMKIFPEELDALIERCPLVQEACSFGVADELYGEKPAVAIVCKDQDSDESSVKENLITWISNHLSGDKIPDEIFLVKALLKNERGKLDRVAIKKAYDQQLNA